MAVVVGALFCLGVLGSHFRVFADDQGKAIVGLRPFPGRAGCGRKNLLQFRPGLLCLAGGLMRRAQREQSDGQRRLCLQHLVQGLDRFVASPKPRQSIGVAGGRLEVGGVDLRHPPEVPFRGLVVVALRQNQGQVEVWLAVVLVERDRLPHADLRRLFVTEFDLSQACTEHVPGAVGLCFEREQEGIQRGSGVAAP